MHGFCTHKKKKEKNNKYKNIGGIHHGGVFLEPSQMQFYLNSKYISINKQNNI
jgi:hypothetical protein